MAAMRAESVEVEGVGSASEKRAQMDPTLAMLLARQQQKLQVARGRAHHQHAFARAVVTCDHRSAPFRSP
eukprot:15286683-Alexandrium_andersonii.AAC.1